MYFCNASSNKPLENDVEAVKVEKSISNPRGRRQVPLPPPTELILPMAEEVEPIEEPDKEQDLQLGFFIILKGLWSALLFFAVKMRSTICGG